MLLPSRDELAQSGTLEDLYGKLGQIGIAPLTATSDPDHNAVVHVTAIDQTGLVGTLTQTGDTFVYDTAGNFTQLALGETATTSFKYTVTDDQGVTATGTETITIIGKNDTPTAIDQSATVAANATVTLNPLTGAASEHKRAVDIEQDDGGPQRPS